MDMVIVIPARRCAVVIGLMVVVLVAASVGASLFSFVTLEDPFLREVRESVTRLVWADGEGNIPAWFSASLLLFSASLLGVIAIVRRQQRSGDAGYWLVLALIFGFLSLDETAQLHELSIRPLREGFHASGFFYYPWIVPAGICVAVLGLGYSGFLAGLAARTRWLFLLAGTLFVGGALGVEAVSGMQASIHGEQNLTYHLIIALEELLEMAGLVVFIYALLDYMGHQFTRVAFRVASHPSTDR
jgi:hypothetical protein